MATLSRKRVYLLHLFFVFWIGDFVSPCQSIEIGSGAAFTLQVASQMASEAATAALDSYWASEGDYDEPYNDVDPDGTYWHDDQTYADEIYWQDDHWDSIGDENGETDDWDHHEAYYGEYLLSLVESYDDYRSGLPEPAFEYVLTNEPDLEYGVSLKEFLTAENLDVNMVANDTDVSPPPQDLPSHRLKPNQLWTLQVHLKQHIDKTEIKVDQALAAMERPRPRLVWEVFAGKAAISHHVQAAGGQTEVFGLHTGWDFRIKSHQDAFMDYLHQEMPDEVFLAPICGPWSPMQNINSRTPEQREKLRALRQWHHDTFLLFVKKVYLAQVRDGRHAHVEQPLSAKSWKTRALRSLPGLWCTFDQCAYNSICPDADGEWLLVKKPTALLTTKMAMATAMCHRCSGDHMHCRLEGYLKDYGISRTAFMEDYQPEMAGHMSAALMVPEPAQPQSWIFAADDVAEPGGVLQRLFTNHKEEAVRTVQRLHRNLGHPAPDTLVAVLRQRGASGTVLDVAHEYRCPACAHYVRPPRPSPAQLSQSTNFNDVVQADVMWLKPDPNKDDKYPIISMVCTATRYMVARLIRHEQTTDFISSLEKSWIRHFGPMQVLMIDEHRAWSSDAMSSWARDNGISLVISPGEAHTRLGVVERRHQLLRRAVEIYLADHQDHSRDAVRKALDYMVPQINALPNVHGYSPAQWVLGKQPKLPGELTEDGLNPGHLQPGDFEDVLAQRAAAKYALIRADTDTKLRRALLRRYSGHNKTLEVGQSCYYWRDARASDLVKIRWRGPAVVAMREDDQQGKPTVYWLVHGTNLLRAAPHHVKPVLGDLDQLSGMNHALDALRNLRGRGVTRFWDLQQLNQGRRIEEVGSDEEAMDDLNDQSLDMSGEEVSELLDEDLRTSVVSESHYGVYLMVPKNWDGFTIFTFDKAKVRDIKKKVEPLRVHLATDGRRVAKAYVAAADRQVRRGAKDKNNLSERYMTLEDRMQFLEAKRKELSSFFENNVWQFDNVKSADPARTLTARILLKWSKNADGSRRAKARLIVRGYADPDALQGLPQDRKLWLKLPADALALLGADMDTRMLLMKPCYGQIDAPRRWFLEATRRLRHAGWRQHVLDPCLFMLYPNLSDQTYNKDTENGNVENNTGILEPCGIVCLHVDDLLGSGDPQSETYQAAEVKLKEIFNFREFNSDKSTLQYCGAELKQVNDVWHLGHHDYLHRIKPITQNKASNSIQKLDPSGVSQLRGLVGALQWPAVQSSPHIQCSASILSGEVGTGTNMTINEANRALKFAKDNSDVTLQYRHIGNLADLRLVTMTDAGFASRSDGSSQGGYITLLVNAACFDGNELPYMVLDWRSYKLPRVCRSSLAAEAQAAGQAVDSMEMVVRAWEHIFNPNVKLRDLLEVRSMLKPTLITDAKALYDSYQREQLGGNTDRRTGLEIMVMKERLQSFGGHLRWMSSELQYADGQTKLSTRQLLADRLRSHQLKLSWDPSFTAAKRKSKAERQQNMQEGAIPKPLAQGDVMVSFCQATYVDNQKNTLVEPEGTFVEPYAEVMDYAVITLLLMFGWCVVRNALSCSCSGRNHTAVTDAVVQTDPMPMDPVITTLEMNLEEANSSNEHLMGQNFRMQTLLRELQQREVQPTGPIVLSRYGSVWHVNRECRHLRGVNVEVRRACRTCVPQPTG
ncbi:unnamed protein product [Effrenium voratum]|uniref:Integrase catalytic domain-containing protein n=1 Tax=Effrenium voratum TaxID=2562239 RepID=A0AA36JGW5_9DINO|nr:unnamed protein product [Effrenium voratum]